MATCTTKLTVFEAYHFSPVSAEQSSLRTPPDSSGGERGL